MLNDLLKQSQPGVNPELESMIAKLMQGSGSSPERAMGAVSQSPQEPGAAGTGAATVPAPAGAAQAMGGQESNQTYQVLVARGVPPEVAQQAIGNPAMLRALLQQLYSQSGPQEAPPMQPGANSRMSAPPLGGGGGYG